MLSGFSGSLVSEHFAETLLQEMFAGALGERTRDAARRQFLDWCRGAGPPDGPRHRRSRCPRPGGGSADASARLRPGAAVHRRRRRLRSLVARRHGRHPRADRRAMVRAARRRLEAGRAFRPGDGRRVVLLHQRPARPPARRSPRRGRRLRRVRSRVRRGRRCRVRGAVGPAAARELRTATADRTRRRSPPRATPSASAGRFASACSTPSASCCPDSPARSRGQADDGSGGARRSPRAGADRRLPDPVPAVRRVERPRAALAPGLPEELLDRGAARPGGAPRPGARPLGGAAGDLAPGALRMPRRESPRHAVQRAPVRAGGDTAGRERSAGR